MKNQNKILSIKVDGKGDVGGLRLDCYKNKLYLIFVSGYILKHKMKYDLQGEIPLQLV